MNEIVSQKITQLNTDRVTGIANLRQKGVTTDSTYGFSQIVSKILEIPSDKLTGVYVDNEVAYRKQVPPNSAGVCYLNSIGGMTYKSKTFEAEVLGFISFGFSGFTPCTLPTGDTWQFDPVICGVSSYTWGVYEFVVNGELVTSSNPSIAGGTTITSGYVDYNYFGCEPSFPEGTKLKWIPRFKGVTSGEYWFPPDCFTDLRDAKPTEVKSYGANLIPFPYMGNKGVGDKVTTGGITYTVNEDRSITINGTTTAGASFNVASFVGGLPSGNYVLKPHYINGAHREGVYISSNVGHTRDNTEITVDTSKKLTWFSLNVEANKTIDNFRVQIMLNLGTTALPYSPYREPITYTLPEAITVKLGKGCSDTIFDEYSFVDKKAITRVGSGEFNSAILDTDTFPDVRMCFRHPYVQEMITETASNVAFPVKMPFFDDDKSINAINNDGELFYKVGMYSSNVYIYVPKTVFPDVASFNAWEAQNPLKFVTKLASYTETDLSKDTSITFDGLIEVEAGGYLEFVNEYGYPVPSTVTFSTINGGGTT